MSNEFREETAKKPTDKKNAKIILIWRSMFYLGVLAVSFYSLFNAMIGSTRLARAAGNRHASNAMTPRARAIKLNVDGSVDPTP